MNELKRYHDRAVVSGRNRSFIQGRVGRLNSDGTVSVTVPGRPNHLHVRIGPEGERGSTIALNQGVPKTAHLPIKLLEVNGALVIEGVDHTDGRLDAFYGGQVPSSYSVSPHTHSVGSGMEYEIEGIRLEPGRVQWSSGLIVSINPFLYRYKGVRKYFLGSNLDLIANLPVGEETWAWVIICVDPEENIAVAVSGPEIDISTPLTTASAVTIDIGELIPLAGIRIRWDDTKLNLISRYEDAREWLNFDRGLSAGEGSAFAVIRTSEALQAGDFVNVWPVFSTPYVRKASAANGRVAHGFVLESWSAGVDATVFFAGVNDVIFSPLPQVGQPLYLDTVAGRVSTAPPEEAGSVIQNIGLSFELGKVLFNPQVPIYLT